METSPDTWLTRHAFSSAFAFQSVQTTINAPNRNAAHDLWIFSSIGPSHCNHSTAVSRDHSRVLKGRSLRWMFQDLIIASSKISLVTGAQALRATRDPLQMGLPSRYVISLIYS